MIVYKSDSFLLFKNKNNLIWLGIHSNKYIDKDGDILTEEAHKKFINNVYSGTLTFPHLFIWHIPVAIGECLWLAYDKRGFLLSGGKIFTKFHELILALVKNTDEMGMSHGMPLENIVYDKDGYIIEYISKEISLLPSDEAANKLTSFNVKEREKV